VSVTIHSILNEFRKRSTSLKETGDKFERLMKAYLQTDPKYCNLIKQIWLWSEFPFKSSFGSSDIGIDLVALTDSGEYWAVQCKCYQEETSISKDEVDSFLATSGKTFQDKELKPVKFSHRMWISTTNKWSANAVETLRGQNPPVNRLNLSDLESAPVDWDELKKGMFGTKASVPKNKPRPHQLDAIKKVCEYFETKERGKLIMACGTGKTFTSLKIAETITKGKGLVLFLVPSISLLAQILDEWTAQAENEIRSICVCSDPKVSSKTEVDYDLINGDTLNLPLPATTDIKDIAKQLVNQSGRKGLSVVFSTYQSIETVSEAQKEASKRLSKDLIFDLIICDEAHRTTGITLSGEEDSAFVRVHDGSFIKAGKRLYMTATPRLYDPKSKSKAKSSDAYLCSMDDESLYGEEIYRLAFGEAVEKDLLSDYKVLVLTLNENNIPKAFQKMVAGPGGEINTDDVSKIIGCVSALSKRIIDDDGPILEDDGDVSVVPMRRAVAFCQSIKISKEITRLFNKAKEYYQSLDSSVGQNFVDAAADHIDGTMDALVRNGKLSWLKSAVNNDRECRILTNVRCLSEGVDVPSLDAVLFLAAKNSQIDVVQSVGRVMRKAEGKKFGYIVIPIFVPSDAKPEEVLDNNKKYAVVWSVLNALRAHDDRFNAIVNKIELNKNKPPQIIVGRPDCSVEETITPYENGTGNKNLQQQLQLEFKELQSVIYAKIVQKVGDRRYLEQWAKAVASIAQSHILKISELISKSGSREQKEFEKFLSGLYKIINPAVTKEAAVEMLAQHLITRPVFDALFEGYSFAENNPVSKTMQKMLDVLEKHAFDKDLEKLKEFYECVKKRVQGIDNAEGRQKVIIELYERFFKTAFHKTVEKLGIFYTPVECVDFIIKSVAYLLKKEFRRDISDENVHILDPFTGTGSFIVRLLQSGLIKNEDLSKKYKKELHANEIVLLAYYIASVNIENAYHDVNKGNFIPFEGICMTDTFQMGETDSGEEMFAEMFPVTSKRVEKQKKAPIRVIIGNPPYSVGQKSANDNAQNERYPKLESRIQKTYVAESNAVNKNSIYNSYIKAFRWSSDRLDPVNGGIIAFISNAGWLDATANSGFRKCLEKEFSSVYVFNLRGTIRGKNGDAAKREGQNVFDTMTGVAITFLVKKPEDADQNEQKKRRSKAVIRYYDIGDYLSRREKFEIMKRESIESLKWQMISPDKHGDWLNKRNDKFLDLIPLYPKHKFDENSESFFVTCSNGIASNRDDWVYNFSSEAVCQNMQKMINYYNEQCRNYQKVKIKDTKINLDNFIDNNLARIKWSADLKKDLNRNIEHSFNLNDTKIALYRPFCKENVQLNKNFIERSGSFDKLFPTRKETNLVVTVSGICSGMRFSTLISDEIIDYQIHTKCFPLYWYEKRAKTQNKFFDSSDKEYIRHDGVSDFILEQAVKKYGAEVTKKDIFYYVYGFLHSTDYRKTFSADLKKSLPHIPLIESQKDFWAFSEAGKKLAELHLNYENHPKPKEVRVSGEESQDFKVQKMRFVDKNKKDAVVYNGKITISDIPKEVYDYVVSGRSPVEWIMERYQIRIDKDSGIKNDPNDWPKECGNPRYILDLLLSVMTLSIETQKITNALPKLKF